MYLFQIGILKSNEEVIAEIDKCIRTDTKQKFFEYADDSDIIF